MLERRVGNTEIVIISGGDVRSEKADALITAINSGGMWFGGIDGAIQQIAGAQFHEQAQAHMPLKDGGTVLAPKRSGAGIPFNAVVFVVDDLERPLREIVKAGLRRADEAGCAVIAMPGIRTGVMIGIVEKTLKEAYDEINAGLDEYLAANPATNLKLVKLVIRD